MHKNNFLMIMFGAVICLFVCVLGWAKTPVEVTIAVHQKDNTYRTPADRTIHINKQPIPFLIMIKNTSDEAVRFWNHIQTTNDSSVQLELHRGSRQPIIIKKKRKASGSNRSASEKLLPGQVKVINMEIDPAKWEGVPVLEKGKVKRFKIQAAYINGKEKLYSPFYDVILGEEN